MLLVGVTTRVTVVAQSWAALVDIAGPWVTVSLVVVGQSVAQTITVPLMALLTLALAVVGGLLVVLVLLGFSSTKDSYGYQ
jgi:hypothetical protein